MSSDQPIRLEGQRLLDALAELGDGATRADQADRTGYWSVAADGRRRYHYSAMAQAIGEASGLLATAKRGGGSQRPLPWRTTVLTTGAVLVGQRYCEELGLQPGDQVDLKIGRGRKLVLEPVQHHDAA